MVLRMRNEAFDLAILPVSSSGSGGSRMEHRVDLGLTALSARLGSGE